MPLFFRAVAALLLLPGIFAGLIPWWIVKADVHRSWGTVWGSVPLMMGLAILLWCVRDFWVAGKGTLAPWDPPKRLVVVGLYRFTRNPMYVGVLVLLLGWTLWEGSLWLLGYSAFLAVAFHLRIVLYEEPRLARQFPEDWRAYSANVPRWLLRLRQGS